MSDRARIEIDCDMRRVTLDAETMNGIVLGGEMEVARSYLIGQILQPTIASLMAMSKDDLKKLCLRVLNGDVTTRIEL